MTGAFSRLLTATYAVMPATAKLASHPFLLLELDEEPEIPWLGVDSELGNAVGSEVLVAKADASLLAGSAAVELR